MEHPISDVENLAKRFEDIVPWETVGKFLDHEGWKDLVEAIKENFPEAYEQMLEEYNEK